MKESIVLRSVIVAFAVVCIAGPVSALAGQSSHLIGKSEKVRYADLNVAKEAGAKQLYRRLQHASKRVCGVESLLVSGSLKNASQAKQCYRNSMDAAVAEINNSMLTKIHKI